MARHLLRDARAVEITLGIDRLINGVQWTDTGSRR
jgi:hypothetical protein